MHPWPQGGAASKSNAQNPQKPPWCLVYAGCWLLAAGSWQLAAVSAINPPPAQAHFHFPEKAPRGAGAPPGEG
jgi:hypothetical protein